VSDWSPPSKYQQFAPQFPAAPFAPSAFTGRVRSTRGLGTALIWLFAANASLLVAVVANDVYTRHLLQQGLASGFRSTALARLQTTDSVRETLFALSFGCSLAALIVLPIWSYRVVRNAQVRGVPDVNPGLALGGWFIPFANVVVPFVQIRRAARPFIGATADITVWQVLGAVGILLQRSAEDGVEPASTPRELLDILSHEITRLFVGAIVMAIALVYAVRAIKSIDRSVSVVLSTTPG